MPTWVGKSAKPGIALRFASRAAAVHVSALSPVVLHRAKQLLLDSLALGLYGLTQPGTQMVGRLVDQWRRSEQSSVFGARARVAMVDAALINGTAIHAVDYDDTFGPGLAHFSAAVLPAVLAVAEYKGKSGAALLAAYVAGYDAAARLALACDPRAVAARGFHPTGCFGTYGAAVGAAHVLGLDSSGIVRAVGLAGIQAAGLMASVGTMAKPLHAGKAATNGVLAALLAAEGFSSADPLSGTSGAASFSGVLDTEILTEESLDSGEALLQTTLKPYPSCWLTHAAIDAARSMAARWDKVPITRIEVEVSTHAAQVCDRPDPDGSLDLKFSLQFVVAAALTTGEVGLDHFIEGTQRDERISKLMARVHLIAMPALRDNQSRVRITSESGMAEKVLITASAGTPEHPLDDAALRSKVRAVLDACGRNHLRDDLSDAVDRLDRADDCEELTRLMRLTTKEVGQRKEGCTQGSRTPCGIDQVARGALQLRADSSIEQRRKR
jgi:2-methylcitrate dehydratase PrpD